MSRDEACGPHFQLCESKSRIVSTGASYSYLRQPGFPDPVESPGDCKNFICVLSSG